MKKKRIVIGSIFMCIILINIFPLKPKVKEDAIKHLDVVEATKTVYPVHHEQEYMRMPKEYWEFYDHHVFTQDNGMVYFATHFNINRYITPYTPVYSSGITKFNENREPIWHLGSNEGIIVDQYGYYIYNAQELSDGSIISLGKAVRQDDLNSIDLALLKISAEGKVESFKRFSELELADYEVQRDLFKTQESRYFQLVPTNDGGYNVLTTQNSQSLLIRFDESDHLLWEQTFRNSSRETEVIAVQLQQELYVGLNNRLIKLSDNGEILWEKDYKLNNIRNLLVTSDDRLIVSGYNYKGDIRNKKLDYFLFINNVCETCKNKGFSSWGYSEYAITAEVKLDSGEFKWISEYGYESSEEFNDYYSNELTLEGKDGYLYSYVFVPGEGNRIVKYRSDGKKLGEVLLENWDYSQEDIRKSNNSFVYETLDEKAEVDLGEIKWKTLDQVTYEDIETYLNVLTIRMWMNRVVLTLLIGTMVFKIAKDLYIEMKTAKICRDLKD